MTDKFDYYTAPPDEIFEDIKSNAIKIWETYDNTYGYVDEKLGRIKYLENISDNAWYIVAMFDRNNRSKLLSLVKPETAEMILKATLTEEQKKEIDSFISYAVKEGYLDQDEALKMNYTEKQKYLDWSEASCQWQYDQEKEMEAEEKAELERLYDNEKT